MPNILTEIANRISNLERRLAQLETIEIGLGTGGGWTEITTASILTAASEFQVAFPQTYTHLALLTRLRSSGSYVNPSTYMQVNGETGASYASIITGAAATANNYWWGPYPEQDTNASGIYSRSFIVFWDYTNNSPKTATAYYGRFADGSVYRTSVIQYCHWKGASPLTTLKIYDINNNIAASSWYTLYGIT